MNTMHAHRARSTPRTCTAATVGPSVDSAATPPHVAAHSPPCGVHRPHAPHVAPDTVCRGHTCPPRVLVPHTRVAPGPPFLTHTSHKQTDKVKEKVDVTQRINTREEHVPATPPPRSPLRSADIAFLKHECTDTHVRCTQTHTARAQQVGTARKRPVPAPPPPCTPRRRP